MTKQFKNLKDWKILEFMMPIAETAFVGKDFFIKGIAINETTTRNGIKYVAEELEKAAPTFRNKPILLDHRNEIAALVGRTTENVNFERDTEGMGKIYFEAKIADENIQKKINQGLIQEVSIGASITDLKEDDEGNKIAVGLEGLEISLVCVPGDPGATLATAMDNSFILREQLKKEDKLNLEEDSIKLKEVKDKMTEEEQKQENKPEEKSGDEKSEEEKPEEKETTEEKTNVVLLKEIADLKEKVRVAEFEDRVRKEVVKQLKVKEDKKSEKDEEPKEEPEDKTKGEVGTEEPSEETTEEGVVIEKADVGKGFQIWKDYSKDSSGKLKRLIR